MKTRKIVEYHENGNIFKEYFLNENGLMHGPFKSWHPNGNEWDECNVYKGVVEGYFKSYYENGTIRSTGHRKNDCYDGMIYLYYPSGNINFL